MIPILIPPIPYLSKYGTYLGYMHLLLSHLMNNADYQMYYRARRSAGDYLIMDNGADELGDGQSPEDILEQACRLSVQEVVAPDVLRDGPATLVRTTQALHQWGRSPAFAELHPRVMIVPQGRTIAEWRDCVEPMVLLAEYMRLIYPEAFRSGFTLGIPKNLSYAPQSLFQAVGLLDDLAGLNDWQFHLLGWGQHLYDLALISHKYPWIRSVDSARPFVYSMACVDLTLTAPMHPKYPQRPDDYFDQELPLPETRRGIILVQNLSLYQQYATDPDIHIQHNVRGDKARRLSLAVPKSVS